MKFETQAVHAGQSPDPTTKAVATPIYQTVAYAFDSAQHGADLFDLKVAGNIYTRIMNPTQAVLEARVAALEGGLAALAVASGQAAITYAIQTIAEAGDNIVSSSALYGGTYNLFAHTFPQYGIETRFADYRKPESFEPLIDSKTKAIYVESLGNPQGNVTDIAAMAKVAHRHGIPLIVDNTVLSPYLCRPIERGADIVVQSLMGGRAYGLLTFGVQGGRAAGERFLDALQLFTRLVNIGDVRSLATHPASTTHRQLSDDQQLAAGVPPDMVRLSVGLEHIDDILWDIDSALAAAAKGGTWRERKASNRRGCWLRPWPWACCWPATPAWRRHPMPACKRCRAM